MQEYYPFTLDDVAYASRLAKEDKYYASDDEVIASSDATNDEKWCSNCSGQLDHGWCYNCMQ